MISINHREPIKDRYDTQVKRDVRQHMIGACYGMSVDRIFTLPSIAGHCVAQFRENWPKSYILGIERNTIVARRNTLSRKPLGDLHRLDDYYLCDVHTLTTDCFVKDYGRKKFPKREVVDIGKFNLIYLDYTGFVDSHFDEAVSFTNRYAAENCVVGLTFTLIEGDNPKGVMKHFSEQTNMSYHHNTTAYENGESKMMIGIASR